MRLDVGSRAEGQPSMGSTDACAHYGFQLAKE
jgi:hypothetical protein